MIVTKTLRIKERMEKIREMVEIEDRVVVVLDKIYNGENVFVDKEMKSVLDEIFRDYGLKMIVTSNPLSDDSFNIKAIKKITEEN